jgi:type I restriction enzyme S subunit
MRIEVQLSYFIDEISMGPFGSDIKVENFVDDGVPVLNGANLLGYKLNDNSFNYVTPEKAKTFRKAIAKRGDVIITHRGTLGQICYVPENSKFEQYVISQSQFRVKFNEAKIDPRYIVYLFHTPYGQKKLLSFKSHVGVPALAQATTNFKALNILVHKLSDQKKIANVITAIEEKIELNNRINAELEQMAKTIYDYWFVQFDFPISAEYAASIGEPELEGKPYKSSGGKMVWSGELKASCS